MEKKVTITSDGMDVQMDIDVNLPKMIGAFIAIITAMGMNIDKATGGVYGAKKHIRTLCDMAEEAADEGDLKKHTESIKTH